MGQVTTDIYTALLQLGGLGLLILGIFDSSFLLFLPLANDLLMVALTANRPALLPFYAVMAAAGSVIGCLITDLVARKGGEEGLEKHVPRGRLEYVKKKVKKNAAWALVLASIIPPPFPFTPFIAAAAALEYPRKKLLAVVAAARLARFFIVGALAIAFGPRILRLADSPVMRGSIEALIIISIGGSALSIYNWAKRSRAAATA